MGNRVLYNGADECHSKECCPVIEQREDGGIVIHDPAKPESGQFNMTVDELRSMLGKSSKILVQLPA